MEFDQVSVCSSSTDEETAICNLGADLFEEDEDSKQKREIAVRRREQIQNRKWGTGSHVDRWAGGTNSECSYVFQDEQMTPLYYTENPGQQQCVWDCSLVLSRYLEDNRELVVGKRVIELGCGLGLPGLVTGAMGAKDVLLTDRPVIVPVLEKEIERNVKILDSRVGAKALQWGASSDTENEEPYDVVLCSDLVYAGDAETTKLLTRTISKLQPKCMDTEMSSSVDRYCVISCHEVRHEGSEDQASLFEAEMRQLGYEQKPVKLEELQYKDPNIKVILYFMNRAT